MVARRAWVAVVLAVVGIAVSGSLAPRAALAEGSGSRSGFSWSTNWNEASAAARAQGKLVLVSSTRAGCCLCDRFANQTAPQCAGRLQGVAVGYLYNISRPENFQVDRVIRANLPGARLMPLVGFLTPDMQWVHGFWGGRNASQLLGDIEYVARVRPARVQPVAPAPAPAPVVRPTAPTPPPPPPPPPPARVAQPAPKVATPSPPAACAPAPQPTVDECCPGGKCDVPSVFDDPCGEPRRFPPVRLPERQPVAATPPACAEPLPVPDSQRLGPPAGAIPGVPDTTALRKAIDDRLAGSPDGDEPAPAARNPVARTFPPPAPPVTPVPRPSLGEAVPERTSSTGVVRPDSGADLVQAAADAGRWGEVLRRARGSSDLRVLDLERRARQWAQDELARGLEAVLLGRSDEALAGLRRVKTEMAGEPAGVDAEHGIDAIETSRDLQRLSDPSSVLARSLKRNKYDELRGTRWARLFEGA